MKLQIKKTNKGFTLLELLFVIAIFAILTATVIYNYGNFNSNIIMSNLAYEVALEIRQAQVYSLGVRGTPVVGEDASFDTRYGVLFTVGDSVNTRYMLFSDFSPVNDDPENVDSRAGNGECNSSESISDTCRDNGCDYECFQTGDLVNGITFDKICIIEETDGNPVDLDGGECAPDAISVNNVNITFARPYTNAIIVSQGDSHEEDDKLNAGIVLKSTGGSKRAVIVRSSGQISVETITNPIDEE